MSAHPAWGIVVDKHKNIYFADITHNGMGSVWKLTNQGKLKLLLSDFHAHNVSLDGDGNLITAHGEIPHTLVKIKQDGSVDTLYHTRDFKEFFGGNCTWSIKSGKVIYGLREHKKLRELDVNGNQKNIGDHKFKWNQTIYVSPDGSIYATEIGSGNGSIVKIDTNGVSTVIAENLITRLGREKDIHNDILLGITEGCDGHIYVAETAGKRIAKILNNRQNETFYTSEKNWIPTAIDFFSGEAFILEFNEGSQEVGPRIIKIEESGAKSVLFNFDTYEKDEILPTTNKTNYLWWFIGLGIFSVIPLIIVMSKKRKATANLVISSGLIKDHLN